MPNRISPEKQGTPAADVDRAGLSDINNAAADQDVTIPLDRDGLVIYYTLGSARYFLNGHTGFFGDLVSDAATGVYEALRLPDCEERWKALGERWGARAEDRVQEVRRLREGLDPAMAPDRRQEGFFWRMQPNEFTVYLAKACNLACRYCFNSGGTFGRSASLMDVETAGQVLSFISGIVRAQVHSVVKVNLFGGEPLLAREATRVLARGLQDLNHEGLSTCVHILLFTNGTIYDQEIFEILAERSDLCTVMTSLDGARDKHDENRPFRGGRKDSSFDMVLANLRRMDAERISYSVACVVLWPFDFIGASEALHELGIRCLEIKEPLYHTYGRKAPAGVLRTEFRRWRENYLAYCEYYLDHLSQPDWVRHVDRLSLPAEYHWWFFNGFRRRIGLACRLAEARVGITPQGEIMPCISFLQHEEYGLGNVGSGFDSKRYDRFEQWLLANGQRRIDNPRCRKCFANLACNGGCYAESLDRTGTLEPDAKGCAYTRERVKINLHFISELRNRYPLIYHTLLQED